MNKPIIILEVICMDNVIYLNKDDQVICWGGIISCNKYINQMYSISVDSLICEEYNTSNRYSSSMKIMRFIIFKELMYI